MITPNVFVPFESKSDHRLAVTHVKISDPSSSSSVLFKTCVVKEVDAFAFGSLLHLTSVVITSFLPNIVLDISVISSPHQSAHTQCPTLF